MNITPRRVLVGFCFTVCLCGSLSLTAEGAAAVDRPLMVETSLFMIMNLMPDSGDFYQLSLGYRLDEKSALFLDGITWKYKAPLGIPYGPRFGSEDEEYPGYVRAFGLGIGYQRFLWRGLFVSLHATPFLQDFRASEGQLLKTGFQLFLRLQLGYRVDFPGNRLYLKPGLSFTYWPINTNLPDAFRRREGNWPNYFLLDPGLNIGFRF